MDRMHTDDAIRREDFERVCDERCTEGVARIDESKSASQRLQRGAIGWILLWVIGIPIPILLLFFLIRGCT